MAPADTIGVGMLGYAFMGKAHSRAFLAQRTLGTPLQPELISISGRNAEKVEEARARYGWAEAVTDWREQVEDDRIGLFDEVAARIDDTALRQAQSSKDAIRAYELVYSALGAR